MKDAYSFDLDQAGARHSYNRMFTAYLRTFKRLGLTAIPMLAESGPIGGDLSHEFIILASTGESEVFCHRDYLTFETPPADIDFDDADGDAGRVRQMDVALRRDLGEARRRRLREAARRSAHFRARHRGRPYFLLRNQILAADESGRQRAGRQGACVHMGSYGIGPSRLAAALIEANHDEAGVIWPEAVAPFRVGLINLKVGDAACDGACKRVYDALEAAGVDVLYDDRDERPGAKFATMDLVGAPHQVIVGPKSLAEGKVELKTRRGGERELFGVEAAIARLGGTA